VEAGLSELIEIDSAGTGGYHVGEPPDARARAAGRRRGIEIAGSARKVHVRDFEGFDYVLAMDSLEPGGFWRRIAPGGHRAKLALLREFDPRSPRGASVPDPYYGGDEGFDEVIDLCLSACSGLAGADPEGARAVTPSLGGAEPSWTRR
jgi:protein-tyrosine phosphatase